jgi:antitoxin component YwqK of YwqJK toxin-antitoxin module
MNLFKIVFISIYCILSIDANAQYWSDSANLDTLYIRKSGLITTISTNARIYRIWNKDNNESLYFSYDSEGIPRLMRFTSEKNGIQYDKTTIYYSNGIRKAEYFSYVRSKFFNVKISLDSLYTEYFENGSIKSERHYSDNKEDGTTVFYYPGGRIETEIDYVNDKMMNVRYFDPEGRQLDAGDFKDGNGTAFIFHNGVKVGFFIYKNSRKISGSCRCDLDSHYR